MLLGVVYFALSLSLLNLPPPPLSVPAAALANDRVIYLGYVDELTGERCEARGTVDAQPEYRFGGVLHGLSVTWEREHRTGRKGSKGVRGPVNAPPTDDGDGDADEWRWAHPRAESELQQRANDIAIRGLAQHRATVAERAAARAAVQARMRHRREAAALRANGMWDPHAMHEVSHRATVPRLHRMLSRAVAQPAPSVGQLFIDVPTRVERRSIHAAVLEQDAARQREADATRQVVAAREAGSPIPGDRVEVFWPAMMRWYSGVVDQIDTIDNTFHVAYDDMTDDWRHAANDRWRRLVAAPPPNAVAAIAAAAAAKAAADAAAAAAAAAGAVFVVGAPRNNAGGQRTPRLPPTYFVDAGEGAAVPASAAGEPRLESYLAAAPTKEQLQTLRNLALQNVTTFTVQERAHPANFFEQGRRCYHCGRQLFVIFLRCTCRGGEMVHDDLLPPDHLRLLCEGAGVSKQSRALNELVRMCSLALPKGTTRCGARPRPRRGYARHLLRRHVPRADHMPHATGQPCSSPSSALPLLPPRAHRPSPLPLRRFARAVRTTSTGGTCASRAFRTVSSSISMKATTCARMAFSPNPPPTLLSPPTC